MEVQGKVGMTTANNLVSEYTVSLPFSISNSGKVSVTESQNDIWADRVLTVIGTNLGERVMNPFFGSKVALQTYDNSTTAAEGIKLAVSECFSTWLPLLVLEDVITSFDTSTSTLSIEVIYQLPNQDRVSTIIGNVAIRGDTPPTEVI